MSAISPSSLSVRISKPLKQVAQRQWTVLSAKALIQILVISMAVLLTVAAPLGYFQEMAVGFRVALAAVAWCAIIFTAFYCLRPAMQRWSVRRAALVADGSMPDTHERISSAVELTAAEARYRGSPELVAHLVKQAEDDAGRVKATTVVPFKSVYMWAAAFVPVLAMWAVSFHFWPDVFGRGLWYTLMPIGQAPNSLIPIVVDPGDTAVIEGDKLKITATVHVTYDKKPATYGKVTQEFDGAPRAEEPRAMDLVRDEKDGKFTGTFAMEVPKVDKSFSYSVSTDSVNSKRFHVTVVARPRITGVDVKYDYPAYTGLKSRNVASAKELNIAAVVGTNVTLTVHTSTPLLATESAILITEGKNKTERTIALVPTAQPDVYTAAFHIDAVSENLSEAQTYQIKLTRVETVDIKGLEPKVFKPDNKDRETYSLTAMPDAPPTVAIVSAIDGTSAGPNEDVKVKYRVRDDYGITHLDARVTVVSALNKQSFVIPVTLRNTPTREIVDGHSYVQVEEYWLAAGKDGLSIPKFLAMAKEVTKAESIILDFQATDNRGSGPQVGEWSNAVKIDIKQDPSQRFQESLNEKAIAKLQDAIKEAIARLDREHAAVVAPIAVAAGPTVAPAAFRAIAQDVKATGTDLANVAEGYVDSAFGEMAQKAVAISKNEIQLAANTTRGITEKTGVKVAVDEIVDSRDKLQALLAEIQKKADEIAALKAAAEKQKEVAKAMEEHPEKVAENKKLQEEAIKELDKALPPDAQKQDPKAAENAKALAELQTQVEKDQQKQTELQNQTAKQEEQQQTEQAKNALAEQQKQLNQEVQQFAEADKKALEQAKAQTPDQKQQQQLVKNIEQNHLQQAADQAQKAADQLQDNAQKLAQQAQKPAPAAAPDQDQKNEKAAADAQKQAAQAAQALKQEAQKPNADAAEQNAQNVEKAAAEIQQQAQKIEDQNQQGAKDAQVQKAAEAAKTDAKQAAQDAHAAAEAQKQVDQAAQAQKQADQAAQALKKEAQKPNADAAEQNAKNTEQAAKQVEAQAQQLEQQNQQGAKNPEVQNAAEAAKADAQQAAKDAQAAAEAAKADNTQEAQKDAAKAAQELAKAGQELNAAAKAEAGQDAQKDAAKAAQELAKAAQELNEAAHAEAKADQGQAQQQNQAAAAQAAEQAKDLAQKQQAIAQNLQQQAAQQADAQKGATPPQDAANQQQQLAQQTQQAQQQAQQLGQEAQKDNNANLAKRAEDAAKALGQAAQEQQQAAKADAAGKPAEAAQAQANAQQDLAKAEQALRGQDPAQAQAQAQPGQPEQGQPQPGQPGQPEQGQPQPGQPQQTPAQNAQEAQQAQHQAAEQPNPAAAAEEAAQALAQLNQAAQQGPPEQGQEAHQGPPHEGEHSAEAPHETPEAKEGIHGSETGGDNTVPESVARLGISASDWAKLPQLTQHELLNASQQTVAPAYREQVKNYFIRRGQMEAQHSAK